ncbi:MAG: YdcF family protein [Alphaproteobacteria bacterium]|nr:YdcF family protein [Alphaproteobacteria bacterium]
MSVSSKGLQFIAFFLLAAALIGFASFSGRVSSMNLPGPGIGADAIIVLTGDQGRLEAGGELLQTRQAQVMLISGVHTSVSEDDILRVTLLDRATLDCCVTLGREARDTAGNAEETADWADLNSHRSLIIVTSDYHMPRSLLLMERAMPHAELIAYPVRTTPPWRQPANLRVWVLEYAKYAMVWLSQLMQR